MTGVKSDSISEKTTERSVLRFFSPLIATMYTKDDWGNLEEYGEEVFPAELCSYETEILKRIAEENLEEEGDRGLAVYLDDPKLEEKIYSMKPTVEVWRGELWGVLEVESHNQLSEREIEAVKEYWEGQESDGWGEGFEQRGIKIPEGELYVSFWNSGDEFFLTTEEGLKETEEMIHALYRIGVDALIVQDMGITKLNLPPIPLHASTQMDNRTPEKVKFLWEAGFRQVVLARELSLREIKKIHESCPEVPLEVFVHGALCV